MTIMSINPTLKKFGVFFLFLLMVSLVVSACTPRGSIGSQVKTGNFKAGHYNQKISIASPVSGNIVSSPLTIGGWAMQSNGIVLARLMDFNDKVVATGMAKVTEGSSEYGYFSLDLYFPKTVTASGWLEIYNQSIEDGSEGNIIRIPVKFQDSFEGLDRADDVVIGQFNNNILLDAPVFDGIVANPIPVSGLARVRSGIVVIRLLDFNNKIMTIRSTRASQSSPDWGTFQRDIPYYLPSTPKGWLEVYTQNPITLSVENLIRIPVSFENYIDTELEQFTGEVKPGQFNDAFILISPEINQTISSPLKITGLAKTFEANVQYRVKDINGMELGSGFVTASQSAPNWGTFEAELNFDQSTTKAGWLELFTTSAVDGTEENLLGTIVNFE